MQSIKWSKHWMLIFVPIAIALEHLSSLSRGRNTAVEFVGHPSRTLDQLRVALGLLTPPEVHVVLEPDPNVPAQQHREGGDR